VIVRDAQGNPTGALKDAAMDYVYKVAPPLSAG
jgi:predicted amidohydrolase YtcJ